MSTRGGRPATHSGVGDDPPREAISAPRSILGSLRRLRPRRSGTGPGTSVSLATQTAPRSSAVTALAGGQAARCDAIAITLFSTDCLSRLCGTSSSKRVRWRTRARARLRPFSPTALGAVWSPAPAARTLAVPCAARARAAPPPRRMPRLAPAHPTLASPREALAIRPTARARRRPRDARRRQQHDQACSQDEMSQHGACLLALARLPV